MSSRQIRVNDETLARAAALDPPTMLALEPPTLPAAVPPGPAETSPAAFPAPQRSAGTRRPFAWLKRLLGR